MKKTCLTTAFLAVALAGCSGAKLKQQQDHIQKCETGAGELRKQVKDRESRVAALEAQVKDLEGQISDLDDKLKAGQERIASLTKSNKDLSTTVELKKGELSGKVGELSGKVKEIVAEKDDLGRRLGELQKDKINAERARVNLQAKHDALKTARDKAVSELAALKEKYDELTAQIEADKTAKDKAQAERRDRLAKVREDMGTLADAVLKEIQAEKAKIAQDGETVVLTLQESLMFKPQQVKPTEEGVAALDRLGRAIQALGPRTIRVEGHADNSTIKWELFGHFTNHWDLSAVRATTIARYLHEHSGLDPRNITATGFGEFRPLKGNDTPEGRETNKRMVVTIGPAGGL